MLKDKSSAHVPEHLIDWYHIHHLIYMYIKSNQNLYENEIIDLKKMYVIMESNGNIYWLIGIIFLQDFLVYVSTTPLNPHHWHNDEFSGFWAFCYGFAKDEMKHLNVFTNAAILISLEHTTYILFHFCFVLFLLNSLQPNEVVICIIWMVVYCLDLFSFDAALNSTSRPLLSNRQNKNRKKTSLKPN